MSPELHLESTCCRLLLDLYKLLFMKIPYRNRAYTKDELFVELTVGDNDMTLRVDYQTLNILNVFISKKPNNDMQRGSIRVSTRGGYPSRENNYVYRDASFSSTSDGMLHLFFDINLPLPITEESYFQYSTIHDIHIESEVLIEYSLLSAMVPYNKRMYTAARLIPDFDYYAAADFVLQSAEEFKHARA